MDINIIKEIIDMAVEGMLEDAVKELTPKCIIKSLAFFSKIRRTTRDIYGYPM